MKRQYLPRNAKAKRICFYCNYHVLNCHCEDETPSMDIQIADVPLFPVAPPMQNEPGPAPDNEPVVDEPVPGEEDPPNDEPNVIEEEPDPEDDPEEQQNDNEELFDRLDELQEELNEDLAELNDVLQNRNCVQICGNENNIEEPFNEACLIQDAPPGMAPPMPPAVLAPEEPPEQPEEPETPVLSAYHTVERKANIGGVDSINQQTLGRPLGHAPDDIKWISTGLWDAANWDGIQTWNPDVLTKEQMIAGIFPNLNTMRGLRQLYYEKLPFKDPKLPTVREIEDWNIEIIKLFRRLLGRNNVTHPVEHSKDLYLKAQWADERKYSNFWDTKYPGTFNSAYGPCIGGNNGHCGATFIPDETDQQPYLNEGSIPHPTVPSGIGGAEGVITTNFYIEWSIKLARVIGQFMLADGVGGHTAPFLSRRYYGDSWVVQGASVIYRDKWSGQPPSIPVVPEPNLDTDTTLEKASEIFESTTTIPGSAFHTVLSSAGGYSNPAYLNSFDDGDLPVLYGHALSQSRTVAGQIGNAPWVGLYYIQIWPTPGRTTQEIVLRFQEFGTTYKTRDVKFTIDGVQYIPPIIIENNIAHYTVIHNVISPTVDNTHRDVMITARWRDYDEEIKMKLVYLKMYKPINQRFVIKPMVNNAGDLGAASLKAAIHPEISGKPLEFATSFKTLIDTLTIADVNWTWKNGSLPKHLYYKYKKMTPTITNASTVMSSDTYTNEKVLIATGSGMQCVIVANTTGEFQVCTFFPLTQYYKLKSAGNMTITAIKYWEQYTP